MKALEILKDIQDSKWCGVKPTLVNWKLEDFNEAIKELEELQKLVLCKVYFFGAQQKKGINIGMICLQF